LKRLIIDASLLLNPLQVLGDPGEASRSSDLAAVIGDKRGDSDELITLLGDQRTTGVALAGGLAVRSLHTDGVLGGRLRSVVGLTFRHGDHLQVHHSQVLHHIAAIVNGSPAGGLNPTVLIGVIAIIQTGQLDLVDQAVEIHMGSPDQSQIVIESNVMGISDEVLLADRVSEGRFVVVNGTVVQ